MGGQGRQRAGHGWEGRPQVGGQGRGRAGHRWEGRAGHGEGKQRAGRRTRQRVPLKQPPDPPGGPGGPPQGRGMDAKNPKNLVAVGVKPRSPHLFAGKAQLRGLTAPQGLDGEPALRPRPLPRQAYCCFSSFPLFTHHLGLRSRVTHCRRWLLEGAAVDHIQSTRNHRALPHPSAQGHVKSLPPRPGPLHKQPESAQPERDQDGLGGGGQGAVEKTVVAEGEPEVGLCCMWLPGGGRRGQTGHSCPGLRAARRPGRGC